MATIPKNTKAKDLKTKLESVSIYAGFFKLETLFNNLTADLQPPCRN